MASSNAEMFTDAELTLVHGTNDDLTKPGLAVVDDIDPWNSGNNNGNAFAFLVTATTMGRRLRRLI